MSEDYPALARLGRLVADALDDDQYPYGGVVRRIANALDGVEPAPTDGHCPGCGGELVQPATGRRRVWCGDRCRDRARKRPGKRTMAP